MITITIRACSSRVKNYFHLFCCAHNSFTIF
nr:MAG TPA: hypothetical protein [Caudoviricetes sp.]